MSGFEHIEYLISIEDPKEQASYHLNNLSAIQREVKVWFKHWSKPLPDEKIYKYMITFTVDPKKTYGGQDKIENYIVKLLSKLPCLEECYYVKEHPHSNVHWHAIVRLKGQAIKFNKFDYYKRNIGRVDISKSKVTNSDEFSSKYLQKESMPIKIK